MRKIAIIGCCAAVVFVSALLVPGIQKPETEPPEVLSSNTLSYSTANENSSQEYIGNSNSPVLSSSQTIYIVREYEGMIGVFAENEDEPLYTVDVAVELLPEADRKMLAAGITVSGRERLNSVLEDYES